MTAHLEREGKLIEMTKQALPGGRFQPASGGQFSSALTDACRGKDGCPAGPRSYGECREREARARGTNDQLTVQRCARTVTPPHRLALGRAAGVSNPAKDGTRGHRCSRRQSQPTSAG